MPVRCAIYTRKSTEEGLEQEFNSLRRSVRQPKPTSLSQRQAGWVALPDRYDDGGFSGASIDRPALRQLLADVEAGQSGLRGGLQGGPSQPFAAGFRPADRAVRQSRGSASSLSRRSSTPRLRWAG